MRWKEYEIAAMDLALALAARGRGAVEPNPMVGATIVKGRRIIAQGFHRRFGGPHAEVEALRKAGRRARGAELFVTLEPCSHFGKTPPCADAIIAAGIKRVVIAMKDPFKLVRGRSIARLRSAGIRVDVGLLGARARELNAPFIRLRTSGLPYVIAKYAMTADGNIATASGDSHWISCETSRRIVHYLRGRVDAIVIGVDTAVADDPLLTARPAGRRVPARIVLDSSARLPQRLRLVRTAKAAPLIVAVTSVATPKRVKALRSRGAEVLVLPGRGRVDVRALLRELGRREMTNVLVEGGAKVLGSFFAAGLVDECLIFIAPKIAGDGTRPVAGFKVSRMNRAVALYDVSYGRAGCDVVLTGKVRRPRH
jgi:diaminohydroxyphosphoribosylaminopyrimidine deaminase/5-amino-6-(5-phosphoribosylamino)uracil reductase